ncbi:Wadjet anti-phage system protein JetD domain-containing protein [Kutzneria sp. 744]|uniref:Wadjet anti-phage system protein JetD domain-containing protein n=1 Tax=Kutzneria sp. (strain 744) TaxID=345341 RepID=UPI0003EEBBBB|nr:Wadjet anti-phage system protein JetD domain-containing protein [Kutzneria sp. 744]EWM19164.1 LigA protein [Kutzneria sp. 744]
MSFWDQHGDDAYTEADDDTPVSCPLLVGEAQGRTRWPLPGLPTGIAAYTVPKKTEAGPVVPKDRRQRPNPRRVDLVVEVMDGSFQLPAGFSTSQLKWVLTMPSRRQWRGVLSKFGDSAWDKAIQLARAGVVVVECATEGFGYQPVGIRLTAAWQEVAADAVADLTGWRPPAEVRAELIALMESVPDLAAERALLARQHLDDPLCVPEGSKSGATRWSVHEAAIRAVCARHGLQVEGVTPTEAKVAAEAFHNSHGWTGARRTAFANLVNLPFALAVREPFVAVLLRGPVVWRIGGVVADARACVPFVGVPANSLDVIGVLDPTRVRGVLVIENRDTFQDVCWQEDIIDRWLCVWGRGYSPNAVITVVKAMGSLPVAGWADLDADGVGIIANLVKRLGHPIRTVGMDATLWLAAKKRRQTPTAQQRGRRLAEDLAVDGPESLRDLAALVAPDGDGTEQELISKHVVPELDRILTEFEEGAGP